MLKITSQEVAPIPIPKLAPQIDRSRKKPQKHSTHDPLTAGVPISRPHLDPSRHPPRTTAPPSPPRTSARAVGRPRWCGASSSPWEVRWKDVRLEGQCCPFALNQSQLQKSQVAMKWCFILAYDVSAKWSHLAFQSLKGLLVHFTQELMVLVLEVRHAQTSLEKWWLPGLPAMGLLPLFSQAKHQRTMLTGLTVNRSSEMNLFCRRTSGDSICARHSRMENQKDYNLYHVSLMMMFKTIIKNQNKPQTSSKRNSMKQHLPERQWMENEPIFGVGGMCG